MTYTLIAGSFEYHHTWYQDPCAPFNVLMRSSGFTMGPVFRWNGGTTRVDFFAAADALRCHLKDTDERDRNVIAYSHGGQPALILASEGFQLRTLSTVGTPCRGDVNVDAAEDHIQYHQAIYDAVDPVRWAGEWDWMAARAYFPRARHYNLRDIGHGKVLLDPQYIPFWTQMGWIEAIRSLRTPAEDASDDGQFRSAPLSAL